jgi:hypothetical protein
MAQPQSPSQVDKQGGALVFLLVETAFNKYYCRYFNWLNVRFESFPGTIGLISR